MDQKLIIADNASFQKKKTKQKDNTGDLTGHNDKGFSLYFLKLYFCELWI